MTVLAGWENFYVIVGSSAGALIGLQFVVMTLIADVPAVQGGAQAGEAFATPTIVHFSAVLLLAGIFSAPWQSARPAAVVWGAIGVAGFVYECVVGRRLRHTSYKPELEDWLCHLVLPLVAYATLTVAAVMSQSHLRRSLFGVGAAALLLLFVGIHNAWDAVTYHIFVSRRKRQEGGQG